MSDNHQNTNPKGTSDGHDRLQQAATRGTRGSGVTVEGDAHQEQPQRLVEQAVRSAAGEPQLGRPARRAAEGRVPQTAHRQPGHRPRLGLPVRARRWAQGRRPGPGSAFGSLDQAPFILLDGDDRSGNNSSGETMYVNLAHAAEITRILVFACIYSGAPNFEAAKGSSR